MRTKNKKILIIFVVVLFLMYNYSNDSSKKESGYIKTDFPCPAGYVALEPTCPQCTNSYCFPHSPKLIYDGKYAKQFYSGGPDENKI